MTAIDESFKQATEVLKSTFQYVVEKDQTLSDESIGALNEMIREAKKLRNACIRKDRETSTLQQLCVKYGLPSTRIWQILNDPQHEVLSDAVTDSGCSLLELGCTAFTDVRGERIVETMRQKIAAGHRLGITVIGPNVTVRFNGINQNLQCVSMQITSVVDSSVQDDTMAEGQ